jgi:hypothetical protein
VTAPAVKPVAGWPVAEKPVAYAGRIPERMTAGNLDD